jgi:rubrerythrin
MKIKCDQCGYKWDYNGKLARPTCPSCRRAIKFLVDTKDVKK